VLLESKIVQVAPLVMSIEPGKAVARKYAGVVLIVAEVLLGLTTIEVTPVSTTETDVDPLQAAQLPADAVIVADPVMSPVTMPEVGPTDTVLPSLEDHATPDVKVFWLPSL
jgi:hypothetical protein